MRARGCGGEARQMIVDGTPPAAEVMRREVFEVILGFENPFVG